MSELYPPINGLGQPFPEDAGVAAAGPTILDKHRLEKYPQSLQDQCIGKKADISDGKPLCTDSRVRRGE